MLKCFKHIFAYFSGRVSDSMGYMALYRKWRPNDFDEVRGQDAIVQTLRNQIIYNRIGHAYLFVVHEVLVRLLLQSFLQRR